MATWVIVLIKDFNSAKQRLQPALGHKARRELARRNAQLAVRAAAAGDRVLVVAGSDEVAALALEWGVEVLAEPRQEGQNVAAARGIARAVEGGADQPSYDEGGGEHEGQLAIAGDLQPWAFFVVGAAIFG